MSTADVLIGLAFLSVGLALAYPALRARTFRGELAAAIAEVEVLRTAAERFLDRTRSWPPPGEPGEIPVELSGGIAGAADLVRDGYTLQWARWEVVDHVEVPFVPDPNPNPLDVPPDTVGPETIPVVRDVGGIVLHSLDDELLAGLLRHFGNETSFVHDATWTLVLPRRADAS